MWSDHVEKLHILTMTSGWILSSKKCLKCWIVLGWKHFFLLLRHWLHLQMWFGINGNSLPTGRRRADSVFVSFQLMCTFTERRLKISREVFTSSRHQNLYRWNRVIFYQELRIFQPWHKIYIIKQSRADLWLMIQSLRGTSLGNYTTAAPHHCAILYRGSATFAEWCWSTSKGYQTWKSWCHQAGLWGEDEKQWEIASSAANPLQQDSLRQSAKMHCS